MPLDESPIDISYLMGLADGDKAFCSRLLETFHDETTQSLKRLKSALAQSDFESVAAVAHSVRSASANISATAVRDSAGRLEDLCRAGDADADKVAALITEIEAMFEEIYSFLNDRGL